MKIAVQCVVLGLANLAVLLNAAELGGRVVAVNGEPLHTTVELRREGDPEVVRTLYTDDAGRFRFGNLLEDTYQLSFYSAGFGRAAVTRTLLGGESVSIGAVVLQVGGLLGCRDSWNRPAIINKKTGRGSELSGIAEERGGTALRRAIVTLTGKDETYRTYSDAGGAFHFSGIRPGLYTLRMLQTGYAEFVLEGVRIRDGLRTEIADALQVPRCPATVECQPTGKVLNSSVCL